MGLIKFFKELLSKRTDMQKPESWLLNRGSMSKTGLYIDETNALKISTVFSCVRILSETVASMPLITYRSTDKGKERAIDHSLYALLHNRPNPEISPYTFNQMVVAHMSLWGNAYCQIIFSGDGRPMEFWPLLPNKMTVVRNLITTELEYTYTRPDGKPVLFKPRDLLHIKLLTLDGIIGLSPIGYAREAMGLALAEEEYAARFFGNGANLGGIVEHPHQISPSAYKNLKESINEQYVGLENSHRVMILEEGMKFSKLGLPPEDAQLLMSRKFQIEEIARMYRVPLHLLNSLDKATNNNIEQLSQEFIFYSIKPWLVNIEQEIRYKCLGIRQDRNIFCEYLVDSLLRGDTSVRFEAYSKARERGWMSVNDIREKENMNRIEGGDTYLTPLNYIPTEFIDEYTKAVILGAKNSNSMPKG